MESATKDKIIEYYTETLPKYKLHLSAGNLRLDREKNVLSRLIKPGMTTLDIGCGVGILSKHMAKLGAKVVAVDITPTLIEYGKEHANHENITYLVADALELNLDQRFDVLLFSDVLEHLPREGIFGMLRRLTRNNTHTNSTILVELPDANFINFMKKHYPEELQLIDEDYGIDYIVSIFEYMGFVPLRVDIYGFGSDCQYNSYVFITKDKIDRHYEQQLKEIYKEK